VTLGEGATLYPHVVIYEGAHIGNQFTAHAHAVVREHVQLGDRVTLQNGCVLGGDGYGFAPRDDGSLHKIVHAGTLVVGDDVEVQSNTTIDRATVGETRIGAGSKIDNLVQVAHGVTIGEGSLLAAQTGISGSSTLGRKVTLAGQVGVAGHVTVGEGVTAAGQCGITSDVAPGRVVGGTPAMDMAKWRRTAVVYAKLPELRHRLRELTLRVEALEAERPEP
jgi:UDP-3-O-[3-hydroxymyristoyl] glucosamine N-acyltransferase